MEDLAKLLQPLLPERSGIHGAEHHPPMAPPNANAPAAYIRTVFTLSGIGAQENLLPPENTDSYHRLSKLLAAMTVMENGIRPHQVDTEAIYQGYKLAFPQNAQELDEWMLGEDEYGEW